jgi:hypothetical protein
MFEFISTAISFWLPFYISVALCIRYDTGWTVGVRFAARVQFFSSPYFQTGFGAHPAFCPVGFGAVFPRARGQGREVDHSPSSSAKVKNGRAIPPLPMHLYGVVHDELSMRKALSLPMYTL